MLRHLYNRLLLLSGHPSAGWILGGVAFLESSVFPLPPDLLLFPMGLSRPKRAYFYALIATTASVSGGFLGYALGYWFFTSIGQWIVDAYHLQGALATFREKFADWGIWFILFKGLTPIPYKIVTIASGIAHYNLALFLMASLVTRGGRFFLLAFLLRRYGDKARNIIDEKLPWVAAIFALLLLGGMIFLFYIG